MRDRHFEIGSEPTFYSGLDDLRGKSDSEKIAWLKGRVDKLVFVPLKEVRKLGVTNQAIFDLNLGVVSLLCSAIEALSSFYLPCADKDRDKFISYVDRFMNPIYKRISLDNGKKYSEILYERYRCGLSHGFTIEGHEVATRPDEYLTDTNGYVSIDLWSLFEDVEASFRKYCEAVAHTPELKKNFLNRFDELFLRPYEGRHNHGVPGTPAPPAPLTVGFKEKNG